MISKHGVSRAVDSTTLDSLQASRSRNLIQEQEADEKDCKRELMLCCARECVAVCCGVLCGLEWMYVFERVCCGVLWYVAV